MENSYNTDGNSETSDPYGLGYADDDYGDIEGGFQNQKLNSKSLKIGGKKSEEEQDSEFIREIRDIKGKEIEQLIIHHL